MKILLNDESYYFKAFIKTVQYLANLTTYHDIMDRLQRLIKKFYNSDFFASYECRDDGKIIEHLKNFSNNRISKEALKKIGGIIGQTLKSGFFSSELINTPEPYAMAFLPISKGNKTIFVIVIGHQYSETLPKYLLNIYLALAGFIGTTIDNLYMIEELKNYQNHLEELVKDRKKAMEALGESEEKYRDLYQEAPNAYFSVAPNKSILRSNKAAEGLLGYTNEEFLNMKVLDLYADTEKGQIKAREIFKRFLKGENIRHEELLMEHKNGDLLWVTISVKPIIDEMENIIGSRSMVINITERKLAEDKLKESEKMYREAYNRAEFYKDIFTHDINNILQSMLSGLQISVIILEDPNKFEEVKTNVKIIKDQVLRGADLVSNIRKLSQLESIQPSFKQIDITIFLEKIIELLKRSYRDRDISIQIDSIKGKKFVCANNLLTDVFENILINAIRHNKSPNVEIIVKISKEQRTSKKYHKIEFIDNGNGVEDDRKKKIFLRAYSEKRSVHGMGLGLSLVKKIIDSYNGRIWVEDRVKGDQSKGSNFIVLIPEAL